MEDNQGAPVSSGLVQMDRMAMLVWQHNIRKTRADGRTNVAEVNTEMCHWSHIFPSAQGESG